MLDGRPPQPNYLVVTILTDDILAFIPPTHCFDGVYSPPGTKAIAITRLSLATKMPPVCVKVGNLRPGSDIYTSYSVKLNFLKAPLPWPVV